MQVRCTAQECTGLKCNQKLDGVVAERETFALQIRSSHCGECEVSFCFWM